MLSRRACLSASDSWAFLLKITDNCELCTALRSNSERTSTIRHYSFVNCVHCCRPFAETENYLDDYYYCSLHKAGLYPEMWSGGRGVECTRMEAPKVPTGVRCPLPSASGVWGAPPPNSFGNSPSKWCILMHSGAHFRPNIIATMMFMTSAEV